MEKFHVAPGAFAEFLTTNGWKRGFVGEVEAPGVNGQFAVTMKNGQVVNGHEDFFRVLVPAEKVPAWAAEQRAKAAAAFAAAGRPVPNFFQ